ncbi:MAG: energy transducer TonB, partial [Gammaproteobacteria bacterium]
DTAQSSLVTAQFPDRMAALAPLAAGATRPGTAELEQIWQALRFDIEQSGAVVRFNAGIATPDGELRRDVLRAGVFAAVAGGEFLRLQGGGTRLAEMERQPSRSYRRIAAAFEAGSTPTMLLDPSRGALLLAEANRPGLFERLWHSGVGGVFIAAVLLLAIALALAQSLWLRSRLILDEQSVGVVAGVLVAFALVHLLLWRPGEPSAAEDQVATITLVGEQADAGNEPPAPELEPPAPPPAMVAPDAPALPALTPPAAMPASSIQLPVRLASSSLSGAFGGFARGSAGRGQGFKGETLIPLSTARPQMPEWACRQKIKGWVEAVFVVLASGRVQDVKIVDAPPRGVYEAAAIESISNWIYAETDRAREVKQRVPMDPADCAYNWK